LSERNYAKGMSTEQIREMMLQLSPEDRAILAKDLLQSLDVEEAPEVCEAAWHEEIEARAAAYAGGQIAADDWQASLERVRARLGEGHCG
jgi:putative addiction module component (TIGR02574 family)